MFLLCDDVIRLCKAPIVVTVCDWWKYVCTQNRNGFHGKPFQIWYVADVVLSMRSWARSRTRSRRHISVRSGSCNVSCSNSGIFSAGEHEHNDEAVAFQKHQILLKIEVQRLYRRVSEKITSIFKNGDNMPAKTAGCITLETQASFPHSMERTTNFYFLPLICSFQNLEGRCRLVYNCSQISCS